MISSIKPILSSISSTKCNSYSSINCCKFAACPTPREHFGAVLPQITACAPQARVVPQRKLDWLGATGVQFEAKTPKLLVVTPEFVSKNCFLAGKFCNENLFLWFNPEIHKIRAFLEMKTFLVFTPDFVEFRNEDLCFLVHIRSIKVFVSLPKFVYAPPVTLSWRRAWLADRKDGFSRYFP